MSFRSSSESHAAVNQTVQPVFTRLVDYRAQDYAYSTLLHIQMRDVPQRLQRRHRVALSGIVPNNADVLHFAVLMYFFGYNHAKIIIFQQLSGISQPHSHPQSPLRQL